MSEDLSWEKQKKALGFVTNHIFRKDGLHAAYHSLLFKLFSSLLLLFINFLSQFHQVQGEAQMRAVQVHHRLHRLPHSTQGEGASAL